MDKLTQRAYPINVSASKSPLAAEGHVTTTALKELDTVRHRIIQRAGRLTHPQGELTLTMSANQAVREDLLHSIDLLQNVA